MKTIPKGIENLIPGFLNYYITPSGWVWNCRKHRGRGGFVKPKGVRQSKKFSYSLSDAGQRYCFTVRELVEGIFGITW